MLLLKHRRFKRFKVDPSCVNKVMPQRILLYAQQRLNDESGIAEEQEVRSFVEVYGQVVEPIEKQKCINVWEIPKRLSPMQTVQLHILYHVSNYFGDEKLFQKARNIPAN